MAGLLNWFWDKVGLGDEDPGEVAKSHLSPAPPQEAPAVTQQNSLGGKVVPITGRGNGGGNPPAKERLSNSNTAEDREDASGKGSSVVVFEPQKAEDFPLLVKHLREGRLVVVSFEGFQESEMRYWLNFVVGATYALDGGIQRISGSIYLVVPQNVDVISNLKEILLARDNQERGRDNRLGSRQDYPLQ